MSRSNRCFPRVALAAILLLVGLVTWQPAGSSAHQTIANRYIVTLRASTSDSAATASTLSKRIDEAFAAENVYQFALKGFSATLTADQVAELADQPEVVSVTPDRPVSLVAQSLPTGIRRIGADHNSTAKIGTGTNPVSVNVAVIDTGSGPHADLNVVGGVDCTGTGSFNDNNGHGSHVAGTIGALDNTQGVVGVAPGARIWSVKVLNAAGNGFDSWVICGIDWVTANAASKGIRIANMSLGGDGTAGASCASQPMRQAICNSVNNAGVTYIVAAGNDHVDVANFTPAAYPEVIAVAALNDTDGLPGGLGPSNDRGCDDCWASFSNYGQGIDMVAPGVDILSTWLSNGYATIDGTSMASPHVSGAAALYIQKNGPQSPANVRAALQAMSDFVVVPNNPIVRSEYVLNVSDGWTNEPSPTPTPTASPTRTNTPTSTATVVSSTPTPTSTRGSIGRPTSTSTPTATATNTATSVPTAPPSNTPTLVPTSTPTPVPTNTSTQAPTPTATLVPTNTPVPTSTPVPGPYPVVASKQSANANSATLAYDGNTQSFWRALSTSATITGWASFDLGSSVYLGHIEWLLAPGGPTGFADGFAIQISNDGQNWSTIATPGPGSPGNWQSLPVQTTVRFIRFYFDNPAKATSTGHVAEVRFMP